MAIAWDRRDDGSVALFIDGSLQFDSTDERMYHECLVLPALAVAQRRNPGPLRVMIAGGGDGLSARELLKSPAVGQIELVDFDQNVIALAAKEFSSINEDSLRNARVKVHVNDAWQFAEDRVNSSGHFDLIISDLTHPESPSDTRMHSIEWYQMLIRLLGPAGILATNSVSPSASPRAYWSILNSMRVAGLRALPYRTVINSFVKLGYGPDWGFILGSPQSITSEEVTDLDSFAQPRLALTEPQQLRKLFSFPSELLSLQSKSAPAHSTSDILLHYLMNDHVLTTTGSYWNSLEESVDLLEIPSAETQAYLLPPEVRQALTEQSDSNEQALFENVVSLIPTLRRSQTRQMIAEFLRSPTAFLDGIDLEGLVSELLRRASELPSKLIAELELLRERLLDWSGEYLDLMACGSRVLAIVAAVVIIGNLMYPDSAYGKGEGGGGHGGGHAGGHAGDHGGAGRGGDRGGDRGGNRGGDRGGDRAGDRGDRGFGHRDGDFGRRGFDRGYDHWGHWGNFNSWNHWNGRWGAWGGWDRPWHNNYWGWGGWGVPIYGGGAGFINLNLSANTGQTVDEEGSVYPSRQYNYQPNTVNYYNNTDGSTQAAQQTQQSPDDQPSQPATKDESDFRLGPDTDIIRGGKVALHLTDSAYLLITPNGTQVIDQTSGMPVMSLYTDPSLIWHVQSEIKRQSLGLQAAQQSKQSNKDWSSSVAASSQQQDDGSELQNMQAAIDLLNQAASNLGGMPQGGPQPPTQPPVQNAMEVFSSVWLTPDGKFIVMKRPDGSLAYMNGNTWYSDAGQTRISEPYPSKFKSIMVAYLNGLVNDATAAQAGLTQESQEAGQRLQALQQQLQQPAQAGAPDDQPSFGNPDTQGPESNRRLQQALRRTQNRLDSINKQLTDMPKEVAAAKAVLSTWQ